MILLVDHYDSFVHNIARYLRCLSQETCVLRHDALKPEWFETHIPTHIVLSPGPGTPSESPMTRWVIETFSGKIPILGICLGHQAIGECFGAKVLQASSPMHGKSSWVRHHRKGIFEGLPSPLQVGRYHSLLLSPEGFPDALQIDAKTQAGEVMAISHATHLTFGVQFHPESILTEGGSLLLQNFLNASYAS